MAQPDLEGSPGSVRRRGPSMADVARQAGVSTQTVSRVSTGQTNVDDDTRDRVTAAMRQLGYRPNSAARALRSGQFRNIGVIMFTLSSFGNMRTLDAVTVAASVAGYSITLLPARRPTQGEVSVAFTRLSEKAVDGVLIIIEAHLLDDAQIEIPEGLPVVVIDSSAGTRYTLIDTNQAEGARQATEHLLDLGHQTVWHLAGPDTSYSAGRRRDSWMQTLEERHREVPPVIVGDWTTESGYLAGRTLGANPTVTAIFAANDQMALGVLRALHELGRSVPQQVSVVGFDDMEGSNGFWPPLTTIHQEFGEVGSRAVTALIDEIEHGPRPHSAVIVPTHLVIRGSSGPPPGSQIW